MDTLTLIISLVLIGGTLALVLYPLWRQNRPTLTVRTDRPGGTLEEYEARYQATLAAIRDLMFDYEMGKVSTEDYETLLPKTKLEAARIRRQIDQLSQQDHVIDPALDAEIETLVAQLKHSKPNGNDALLRDVEAEIESLKSIQFDAQSDAFTCPRCGKPAQVGDAFCSSCGQSLANLKISQNACPECGFSIQPDDVFCAKCGTALTQDVTTRRALNPYTADNA